MPDLCGFIVFFFFFKQKTAYEMLRSLVGSEMCIRDSINAEYGDHRGWHIIVPVHQWCRRQERSKDGTSFLLTEDGVSSPSLGTVLQRKSYLKSSADQPRCSGNRCSHSVWRAADSA
eukprot:TRINITY_DN15089_c0_g1_i1.p2 TRINITY_DN15089_c0_g1~~TRINITY_DN15089_c0_g1_i1.p2  ORF type:complete len:117 (+),score=31.61 TRINITY_DN15089_c0_g1_i1:86-436(+)